MVWLLVSVALTLAPLDAEASLLWVELLFDALSPDALLPDVLLSEVPLFDEPASPLGALGTLPVAELLGPPCAFPADPDAAAPPLAPLEVLQVSAISCFFVLGWAAAALSLGRAAVTV